jgi:hypothetical protein
MYKLTAFGTNVMGWPNRCPGKMSLGVDSERVDNYVISNDFGTTYDTSEFY